MNLAGYEQIVVTSACYLAATLVILLFGLLIAGRDGRIDKRIRGLAQSEHDPSADWRSPEGLTSLLAPEIASTFLSSGSSRIQAQFREAGFYSPRAERVFRIVQFVLIVIPLALAAPVHLLGFCSSTQAAIASGIGAILGAAAPIVWLRRRIRVRQLKIRKSLPDFLDLTVTCLEAGLSIHAALREVASELQAAHPALSEELSIVLSELELGKSIEEGLRNFAARAEMDELRTLAAFVRHATQFGTTMADAIRQLSDMLRSQRELRAEELAQKAAVKILLPTLLFIFPTVFVVLVGPAAIQIHEGFRQNDNARAKLQNR
jgi:tight adherence protein C